VREASVHGDVLFLSASSKFAY